MDSNEYKQALVRLATTDPEQVLRQLQAELHRQAEREIANNITLLNARREEIKEQEFMELTGNVVVDKDLGLGDAVRISCPKCNAPKGQMCDPGTNRICAERVIKQFVKESKPLVGPFTD